MPELSCAYFPASLRDLDESCYFSRHPTRLGTFRGYRLTLHQTSHPPFNRPLRRTRSSKSAI